MDSTICSDIWSCASACFGDGFGAVLDELLNDYVRRSGKDEPVRITINCIGREAYAGLLTALQIKPRRHVSYYDYGWHIELRTWLFEYLSRSLQRSLVQSGSATPVIREDLLAYDLGL